MARPASLAICTAATAPPPPAALNHSRALTTSPGREWRSTTTKSTAST
jgi:hypothetical protein